MNKIHIYLMVCVFLVCYLQISNALYMFKKFSSVCKQGGWDRRIKCAKILPDICRTFYLIVGGAIIVFKFWVQDTNTPEGYFESVTKFKCANYKYIPIFMHVEVIQLSRLFFAFSQLYQTRRMLGKSFGKKNTILLTILLCSTCAIIAQTDVTDEAWQLQYRGHPVCILPVEKPILIMWVCITTAFEMVMLVLYIYPLWKLDLSHGRSSTQVRAYSCFHKDKTESLLKGEDAYHGVCLTSSKENIYSMEDDFCTSDLLSSYHKCLLRNSWSGVLGILFFLQFIIAFLVLLDTKAMMEYWFSGSGIIHYSVTFFAIYICLVLSDRDWRKVLVPCECRIAMSSKPVVIESGYGLYSTGNDFLYDERGTNGRSHLINPERFLVLGNSDTL